MCSGFWLGCDCPLPAFSRLHRWKLQDLHPSSSSLIAGLLPRYSTAKGFPSTATQNNPAKEIKKKYWKIMNWQMNTTFPIFLANEKLWSKGKLGVWFWTVNFPSRIKIFPKLMHRCVWKRFKKWRPKDVFETWFLSSLSICIHSPTVTNCRWCHQACSDLATCENTIGSYQCICKEGFKQGQGKNCDGKRFKSYAR